jgi:hypothetical protein
MDTLELINRRINELRKKYNKYGTAETRYRIKECERLRKLIKAADTGRTTEVVALHTARPKAVPKSEEDRAP